MMKSIGGKGPNAVLLAPLHGTSYEFRPVSSVEGQHQSTARLLELVIKEDSTDCPDSSLIGADGTFRTGDLFQEVSEGQYMFKGRDDDWIKTESSLRCDTKYVALIHRHGISLLTSVLCRSIEDNVRQTCAQLVSECIVVGTGRPSPCLFIETTSVLEHAKLAKDIIRKNRAFNQRRYLHERLNASLIVVVPPHTLPRTATKGNIRRKAVEEKYSALMDELYAKVK